MPRKPKEQRTEDGRVIQFTTIKARLYPNGAQAELFEKTFGCCRYIWNRMLADQQRFYRETGAHFIPTPAKYKKEAPFLREVDNQALIQEHNKLSQAFRVFFRNPDSKASAGKIGVDADGLSINGKKFSVSNDNGVLTFKSLFNFMVIWSCAGLLCGICSYSFFRRIYRRICDTFSNVSQCFASPERYVHCFLA